MVSRLRRAEILPRNDPHGWNSWDNYRNVHERRLTEHHFVISYQDSLVFQIPDDDGPILLDGFVTCRNDVQLHVTKKLAVDHDNSGRRFVRCFSYRYIGVVPGSHILLKYHNLHDDSDEYIHRVYDPRNGVELFNETLRRDQFPTFPEVLDELAYLAQQV